MLIDSATLYLGIVAKGKLTGYKAVLLGSPHSVLSPQGVVMHERVKSEIISRRSLFSLLGMAAIASLVVPTAVITATDAEAAVGDPTSAASVAGMNRRDRRRDRRDDRRTKKKNKKKK